MQDFQVCMQAATPNTILRLAASQTKVFFRPSPHFFVAATARQLGNWARSSDANEDELAPRMEHGIDGLLSLALEHCRLTMERIRELHLMRFSIINPVTNIIVSSSYPVQTKLPLHLLRLFIGPVRWQAMVECRQVLEQW